VTGLAEAVGSPFTSSAFWTAATLCAYLAAGGLQRLAGPNPVLNPVAVSVALVVAALAATGTSYEAYSQSTGALQALLGPATVALAVPLHENLVKVRRAMVPLLAAVLAGSVTAAASAVLVAAAFGAAAETTASLVPKSVTMPIAMAIADGIGGLASLAAAFVMLTGVIGAIAAPPLFRLIAVRDERARGVALGVAAHGIGLAQAFQSGQVTGTFAGVAMGLTGLVTALAVSLAPMLGTP
jgi:putative effector of murein hydrolase